MREKLNITQRNELAGLLLELSITEVHKEVNRFMDKKDTKKALEMIEVEDAINIILKYLE